MKSLVFALVLAPLGLVISYAQDDADPAVSDSHAQLEKVKAAFKETWVHPDADFTQYDKVYLWEGQFEYRDVGWDSRIDRGVPQKRGTTPWPKKLFRRDDVTVYSRLF